MKQKTKKNLYIFTGLSLVFLGFLIHSFYWLRLILIIIGVGFLVVGKNQKYRKHKFKRGFSVSVIILGIIFIIDTCLALIVKIEPVIALYYKADNITIYNAIGYRTWRCQDQKIVIDYFYQKEFLCDAKQIKTIEINTFSNQIITNYAAYDNQFVKIKGRISRIDGLTNIEMQAYNQTDNSVNGYVQFADGITLRVNFDSAQEVLTNYELYDIITVMGRIKDIAQNNDQQIINMVDSQIISDNSYQDFKLSLASNQLLYEEPKLTYNSPKLAIWNQFANSLMVTFNNQEIYELEFVLSSNKLTVNQILAKANTLATNYEQTIKVYSYNDYQIFVGQKREQTVIVIADLKTKFTDLKAEFE